MSQIYPGGVISRAAPTTVGPVDGEGGTASGIWTLEQVASLNKSGLWPKPAIYGTLFLQGSNTYGELGLSIQGAGNRRSSPTQVGAASYGWSLIAAGHEHGVAITTDGTLWSWGKNSAGQLGLGTVIPRSSPVQIGTDNNWSKIDASGFHSIAAKTTGTLWAWGRNFSGELGDNTTIYRSSPVQIGALTTWSLVSNGYKFSAAIKTDGTLWQFGENTYGQLGDNTVILRSSPIQVGALTTWSKITSINDSAVALKTDGTLWAWGRNRFGQLGLNDIINRSSPVQVGALTTWSKIDAGGDICLAVKTDGTLWSWGNNDDGQLGDSTVIRRSSPIQVGALTTWSNTSPGVSHVAATQTNGTLWTWGGNTRGNLGINTSSGSRSSPVQVGSLTTWSQVSAGSTLTMAMKTDTTLWTFGYNAQGQLGENSVVLRSSPVQIGSAYAAATTNWWKVGPTSLNVHAIKLDGTLWAWGRNIYGAVGDNTVIHRSSPVQIGALTSWTNLSVSSSGDHGSIIKTDGTLWAFGYNTSGQLGDNTQISRSSPVQIGSDTNWSQVSKGGNFTLATRTNGTLWTWGSNTYGTLGDNTVTARSSPVQIGSGTTWLNVAAGGNHSLALKTDGTLWSFGYNGTGTLGDNTRVYKSSPVQIGTLTTWSRFSASSSHTAAVKTDGTLWLWGTNSNYGQVGDGTRITRSSPVQVGTGTSWLQPSLATNVTTVIKTDGTLWSWGSNNVGQLGLTDLINRSSPVQVGAGVLGWSLVESTAYSTLGIKTNGTLYGWGQGDQGQVGDNTTISRSSPVQIGTGTTWSKLGGGDQSSFAIKTDGTMWSWGFDEYGTLGQNTNLYRRSSPVQVGALTTWSSVSSFKDHVTAIKTDGTLWAWGRNEAGKLGDVTQINRSSPVQIGTLTTWAEASPGRTHTIARQTNGTLWAWGQNFQGQLGINIQGAYRSSPTQVGADSTWSSVTGGDYFNLAIKTNGTLWSWGQNNAGQLGLGDQVLRSSPVQIGALTTWSKSAAGQQFSFAIKNDGTLWSWGADGSGKLGQNTLDGTKLSPTQIGTATNWSTVSAGDLAASALTTSGTLYGWGYNLSGAIGDNTRVNKSSPTQVGATPFADTYWLKPLPRGGLKSN